MPSLRQRCGSDKHGTGRGPSGHQLLHLGPYHHLFFPELNLEHLAPCTRLVILPQWTEPEKAMAPHSSTLAWTIPWTEEPGRLQSMGSLRVGHDWATSLSLFTFMHWRRKWQPTPVFLPGIPGTEKPSGLLSMGSHRVRHDWSDLAAAVAAVNSTPPPTPNPPAPLILFFHIPLWLLNGKSKIIHLWELFTSTTVRKPAERLDTVLGKSGVWNGESKVCQTKGTSQSLSGRFSLTQNHPRHQANFIWGRWTFLSPWDEQPQG